VVPALEVADIFRRHGEVFRQARAGHLGGIERRIMGAITACRTAVLGGHVEQCDDCGAIRIAYNSCRNRHCPKCQGLARAQWLADRQTELLPVPYFHVVFTLPALVGEIAFQNKSIVYTILFRTAAETLATIAADPRHLGAKLGMTMVLHTWGQTLQHHPHVHCVVPGGGPSLDGTRWVACRITKVMTLDADEFIRRFLLHALPDGFHRIRHYGFLANGARADSVALCQRLLDGRDTGACEPADNRSKGDRPLTADFAICPDCGGTMRQIAAVPRSCNPQPFSCDTS
jgi:Transposase zinc-binding domain/Putative transposase